MGKKFLLLIYLCLFVQTGFCTYNPLMKPLPTVYISDWENWVGTNDTNFFFFTDALNLDDYVVDNDTLTSELEWSFYEGGTQYLKINGIYTLSDPLEALKPSSIGKDIRHPPDPAYQPGEWIDFWDIKDSPEGEGPPWDDPEDPLNEIITFFVSDGTGIDSGWMIVCACDNCGPPSPPWCYGDDFEGDYDDWEFTAPSYTAPDASYGAATSHFNGSMIGIETDNTTNSFGFWGYSSSGPLIATNHLYKVVWSVTTDQPRPENVPTIRFRVLPTDLSWSNNMIIHSYGEANPFIPQMGAIRDYTHYIKSFSESYLSLNFDVYDFDWNDEGIVWLDKVVVYLICEPDERDWEDVSVPALTEWVCKSSIPPFNAPTSGISNGEIQLASGVSENFCFGFWESAFTITLDDAKFYRTIFRLQSSDANPPNGMMRISSEDYQVSYRLKYYYQTAPDTDGEDYPLYFETHEYIPKLNKVSLNFEIADFESTQGGVLTLTDVTMQKHDIPSIPVMKREE